MAREKPDYRDNLELLNTMYPGVAMLSIQQVMELTGWKDYRTVHKHLNVVSGRISKVAVAKMMS